MVVRHPHIVLLCFILFYFYALVLISCVALEKRFNASMLQIPHLTSLYNPQASILGARRRGRTQRADLNVPSHPGSSWPPPLHLHFTDLFSASGSYWHLAHLRGWPGTVLTPIFTWQIHHTEREVFIVSEDFHFLIILSHHFVSFLTESFCSLCFLPQNCKHQDRRHICLI